MKTRNVVSAIGVMLVPFIYTQYVGYENIKEYLLLIFVVVGWFIGDIIGRLISNE